MGRSGRKLPLPSTDSTRKTKLEIPVSTRKMSPRELVTNTVQFAAVPTVSVSIQFKARPNSERSRKGVSYAPAWDWKCAEIPDCVADVREQSATRRDKKSLVSSRTSPGDMRDACLSCARGK